MEKKVNYIPAARSLRQKKVGIYCRVSTNDMEQNDMEQLNSLTNQISALTRLVSTVDEWKLMDCYVDIASAKKKSLRVNFQRMLDDCKSKKLDIVIIKSVSRFGRDTVDTLQALKVMKECGVRVIFEQENLDTKDVESSLMISIIESLAQAENESRSDNIKWGIRQRAAQGISKLYDRKCYGYDHDEDGKLIINEEQAAVVRKIFNWYLGGLSINDIKHKQSNPLPAKINGISVHWKLCFLMKSTKVLSAYLMIKSRRYSIWFQIIIRQLSPKRFLRLSRKKKQTEVILLWMKTDRV